MMRFKSIVLLLLFVISFADALKVLIYQIAFSNSHLPFSGAMADALIDRGHTVDKLIVMYNPNVKTNGSTRLRNVYRVGVDDNPFMKSDHLVDPFTYTTFSRRDARSIKTRLVFCQKIMEDHLLISKLQAEKYDSLLFAPFDFCAFALNHILKIPSLNAYSVLAQDCYIGFKLGLPMLPSYVPQVFDGRVQPKNKPFWQRLQSFIYMADYEYDEMGLGVDEYKYLRNKFPDFPTVTEMYKQVNYIFINTNELLDIPQPTFSRLKYLGGIAMKPNDGKLTEEVEEILSIPNQGTVLFSFGSLIQTTSVPLDTKIEFLRAFKHFPNYSFIWKIHPEDEIRHYLQNYTNVHAIDWLPQIAMLNDKRVKAFITHGGMNSYLEASHAGQPLIEIPFFVDQFYNAASVLHKETGVYVSKWNISVDSMTHALNQVLYNDKYRRNAQQLAAMLKDRTTNVRDEFVKAIEYSAKHPHLHKFIQLEAADLPSWKLYSVDVIAFLFLSAIMSVVLAGFVIKYAVLILKYLLKLVFVQKQKSKCD